MSYKLVFTQQCKKQIDKLDNSTYSLLKGWIKKHLLKCDNPKALGKAFIGNKKGLWRYKIGSYRLIVQIQKKKLIVLAIDFGHRSNIYQQ